MGPLTTLAGQNLGH